MTINDEQVAQLTPEERTPRPEASATPESNVESENPDEAATMASEEVASATEIAAGATSAIPEGAVDAPEAGPVTEIAADTTSALGESLANAPEAGATPEQMTPPEIGVSPGRAVDPFAGLEAESPVSVAFMSESSQPPSAPTSSGVEVADDLDLFDAAMASLDGGTREAGAERGRRLQKNQRVDATVIAVTKDRVFVDLGTKSEGVLPLNELTDDNVETCEGLVQVGDKIRVVVVRPEGGEGGAVVSKKRADYDSAWDRVVEAFETGDMITAQVVDRVKGGLVVDVGVRGFVPATHVGSGKLRNIEKYVGQPLELKVIELDKERRKVVLSNREAEEKRREELKDKMFTDVKTGDVLDGTVRRLTDYGAFIDLGGMDGLLHISEMSWMRINHPKEVIKEGQSLKVMVLRLEKEKGKISLGLRQVLPDPWKLIEANYKVGQKLTVVINRIVQSGAFVKLPEGAEAFLPVSELSFQRVNRPQDVIEENQEVEVTVIDLRPEERRMVLSLKAGTAGSQQIGYGYGGSAPGEYDSGQRGARPAGGHAAKGGKKKGGPRRDDGFDAGAGRSGGGGGATIGERLGALKGFHFRSEENEGDVDAPATEEKSED